MHCLIWELYLLALSLLTVMAQELPDSAISDVAVEASAVATPQRLPVNYGMILFPAFEPLDVFGPLEALNLLSREHQLNLYMIAPTNEPVSTKPRAKAMNPKNSTFAQSVLPTHTYTSAPPLDVLMVPGGLGTRAPNLNSTVKFIADTYPTVQYLLTICTGSGLVARTGILDGRKATTNKASFRETVALGPRVDWIPRARWTVDGNIWTSSGISAGIDATLAFIEEVYGEDKARKIANLMEYERRIDSRDDPFAEVFNTTLPGEEKD